MNQRHEQPSQREGNGRRDFERTSRQQGRGQVGNQGWQQSGDYDRPQGGQQFGGRSYGQGQQEQDEEYWGAYDQDPNRWRGGGAQAGYGAQRFGAQGGEGGWQQHPEDRPQYRPQYRDEEWQGERGGRSFGGGMGSSYGRGFEDFSQGYPQGGSGQGYSLQRGMDFGYGPREMGGYGPRRGMDVRYGQQRAIDVGYGGYSQQGGMGSRGLEGQPHSQRSQQGQRQAGPHAGRGPKGYQRSDERIREDVCDRLEQSPEIDASEIEVQVKNGIVTLTGTVDRREDKRLAEELIESCAGVKDVLNQLRMSSAQGGERGKESKDVHESRESKGKNY